MNDFCEAIKQKGWGDIVMSCGDMTLIVPNHKLIPCLTSLKTNFAMDMLVDLTACDYLTYGQADWQTHSASSEGFSRGRDVIDDAFQSNMDDRFAIIYHLLSVSLNQRIRIRSYVPSGILVMPSVTDIWPNANWYEREVYDLFGIVFDNHPDLRRILTDYGFIGHPFRKDYPLIGRTEIRYDGIQESCVYEPVSIEQRVNVPRVIRGKKAND